MTSPFSLTGRRRGTCRSCQAPVVWALTPANKKMPLDPDPTPDGNLIVTGEILAGKDAGTPTVLYLRAGEEQHLESGRFRYTSHFATCPFAGQHRRT